MQTVSQAVLDEITQRLVKEFQPEAVILFGSRAWGMPGDDSDIDLLVIVTQSDLKPTQRAARAYRCLHGVLAPIDVLMKTRAEFEQFQHVCASLEHQILAEGKVLYGRRETAVGAEPAH